MRIQLSLDKEGERDLNEIKEALGVQKTSHVYDLALGLLMWAVESRLQGFEIAKYDESTKTARLLSLRELDRVGYRSDNGTTEEPSSDSVGTVGALGNRRN